jgi:uncharacterized protein (DUF58 family)
MNLKLWIRKQFRRRSRVYIFPTKMGGYLIGLIFLMFLLSIGYSNNLLLIFTLFLFAFNVLWLIQSHFHLHKLKLSHVQLISGHAGDPLEMRVAWEKTPPGPWGWQMALETSTRSFSAEVLNNSEEYSSAEMKLPKRGVYQWKYLGVKSTHPFGLYQVWIYYPLDFSTVVFPPLLPSATISPEGLDSDGEIVQDRKGQDDFRGLAPYQEDESRKISWKHYARSGDLVIREGEEKRAAVVEIDLKIPTTGELKEQYLSRVATQLVECYRREIPFTLKTNSHYRTPSAQLNHLQECLKVLALC